MAWAKRILVCLGLCWGLRPPFLGEEMKTARRFTFSAEGPGGGSGSASAFQGVAYRINGGRPTLEEKKKVNAGSCCAGVKRGKGGAKPAPTFDPKGEITKGCSRRQHRR